MRIIVLGGWFVLGPQKLQYREVICSGKVWGLFVNTTQKNQAVVATASPVLRKNVSSVKQREFANTGVYQGILGGSG